MTCWTAWIEYEGPQVTLNTPPAAGAIWSTPSLIEEQTNPLWAAAKLSYVWVMRNWKFTNLGAQAQLQII